MNPLLFLSLEIFEKLDINATATIQDASSSKQAFLGLQKLMTAVNDILVGIRQ